MVNKTEKAEVVQIRRPKFRIVNIPVRGTMPIIMQRMDPEYVEETITGKETGKNKPKKLRNFDEEYERCFHKLPNGGNGDTEYGFPAAGFFGAIMNVAKDPHLGGITGKDISRHLSVLGSEGGLVPLKYEKIMRVVDNPIRSGQSRAPDTRHRPYFYGWSCVLPIRYDADFITLESIINLLAHAGVSSGVGSWRPSSPKSPGPNGTFEPEYDKIVGDVE